MAGLLVDTGITSELNSIRTGSTTWSIHLYQNNHAPAAGDTPAAYTEANYDGYAAQTPGAWTVTPGAGGVGQLISPSMTFLDLGPVTPNTIYGYYVTDLAGNLVMAELFGAPGPYTFNALGIGIVLTINQQMNAV